MSYTDIYNIASNPDATLRKQIAVAVFKAAMDVANDQQAPAERRRWALNVLEMPTAPKTVADQAIWLVLQNPTILAAASAGAPVPDGDVQFVVNSVLDKMVPVRIAAGG